MKYIIICLAVSSFVFADFTKNEQRPIHTYGYVNKKAGDKYFVYKAQKQKQLLKQKVFYKDKSFQATSK